MPHYLPVAPNPKAALALVERLAELLARVEAGDVIVVEMELLGQKFILLNGGPLPLVVAHHRQVQALDIVDMLTRSGAVDLVVVEPEQRLSALDLLTRVDLPRVPHVPVPLDGHDGPEHFLVVRRLAWANAAEHGRRIPGAAPVGDRAAEQ